MKQPARIAIVLLGLSSCQSQRVQELEERVAALEEMLEVHRHGLEHSVAGGSTVVGPAMFPDGCKVIPVVSGAVLLVSRDQEVPHVIINRGSADGVAKGTVMEVFSGGMYKGKVRVVDVQERDCRCVIVMEMQGRAIDQGDSARTHI